MVIEISYSLAVGRLRQTAENDQHVVTHGMTWTSLEGHSGPCIRASCLTGPFQGCKLFSCQHTENRFRRNLRNLRTLILVPGFWKVTISMFQAFCKMQTKLSSTKYIFCESAITVQWKRLATCAGNSSIEKVFQRVTMAHWWWIPNSQSDPGFNQIPGSISVQRRQPRLSGQLLRTILVLPISEWLVTPVNYGEWHSQACHVWFVMVLRSLRDPPVWPLINF